jgi:hypothetical protein
MICSSLNLLVLMSIILRVDGLLGEITGTVYGGQVTGIDLTKKVSAAELVQPDTGLLHKAMVLRARVSQVPILQD